MPRELEPVRHELVIDDVELSIAGLVRRGEGPALVLLHGFGSTKEDYADIVRRPALDGRPVLAYDAPGCGASDASRLDAVDIPFLVDVAARMIDREGIDRFHLAGHSMGGLTGLLLADAMPERVASFTSIEGNVAPEDCFLSRQIIEFADPDPESFFDAFVERAAAAPAWASSLYATSLQAKVRPGVVESIFRSMVDLSDHARLMERFLGLPCPTMLMFGDQNADLTYLPMLREHDVRLAEIRECGHFPMYSNPPAMWRALESMWVPG
ncbi:MAG: alpha/beta fold hydrolase [Actinomycetota bacterium]